MKKISLFTPCYNEEGNVYAMYERVTEVMKQLPGYTYEYVFIDNHSTDHTRDILRKIASQDKRVKVIFNLRNFGPSRSGSYGFFQTTGDCSICFACDFQDPPELIPEFVRHWEQGHKVVWGQKAATEEKGFMAFCRKEYYKIVKNLAESKQYEDVTGFGLYDREVMDLFREMNDPQPNFRNLIGEFGYEADLIRYDQPVRKQGRSSYNFFKYMHVAITSVVTTSKVPLEIASYIGFLFAAGSFLVALVYLVLKLLFWNSFNIGLAPLVTGFFFLSGIQLITIGILGEYIGEILTRQMGRPLVVEEERINFEAEDPAEDDRSEKDRHIQMAEHQPEAEHPDMTM